MRWYNPVFDYVGDTLMDNLLNVAGVRMVSRRNIEAVKQEQARSGGRVCG
jgi:hypothetical protein